MPDRKSTKRKPPGHLQSTKSSPDTENASNTPKKLCKASASDRDLQRERKRATDRQAQRMARERTKQYIAHLEKTIEILKKESGSDTVTKLLHERNQLALDVQQYRKVMYGMRLAIDGAISGTGEGSAEGRGMEDSKADSTNGSEDSEEPILTQTQNEDTQPVAPSWSDPSMFRGIPSWDEMGLPATSDANASSNHDALGLAALGFMPAAKRSTESDLQPQNFPCSSLSVANGHDTSKNIFPIPYSDLYNIPLSRFFPLSMVSYSLSGHSYNDHWWKTANQSYSQILSITPYGSQAANLITTSMLFQAILNNWSHLPLHVQENPVTRIIREIDEIFQQKDRTSRLALAIKCHRMIKFYLNACPQNLDSLPAWQRPTSSQRNYKHPIAIDFFAWPGLRDRMIKEHSVYFRNADFSEAYRRYFKFSWPGRFEDTYQYNSKSDTYTETPLFERHHGDLRNWRFEESFFRLYPELVDAIQNVKPDMEQVAEEVGSGGGENSTAMMAATQDFPDTTSAMGRGVQSVMTQAARGFGSESGNLGLSMRDGGNMGTRGTVELSLAEQVGIEGLGDLWMAT